MADLCSLYQNVPYRDRSIKACADCLQVLANKNTRFKSYSFTDLFDISGGTQPPKSKFVYEQKDDYTRFLQIRDFSSESTLTYIPNAKNNKICNEDDLLLGRYGASVGKILTGKSGAYNVACAKILFKKPQLVDKKFLFYWLHSSYFQTYLTSISRSAQGGFNKNDLTRISISIPDIEIQRQLVAILERIDDSLLKREKINLKEESSDSMIISFISLIGKFLSLITNNEDLSKEQSFQLSLVKQLRQAFLREAMQSKLVPQDPKDEPASVLLEKIKAEKEQLIKEKKIKKEKPLPTISEDEIPFEIPENWVWCRLGEISEKIGSGSTPKGSNYSLKGFPFFRSQNVHDSGVNYDDIKYISAEVQKKMLGTQVIANDILLNITGGSMGRCALVPRDFEQGNVSQHVSIIRPILCDNSYIHKLILSPLFQHYIFSSTTGAGREGLPKYNLEQFVIPLPPIHEQRGIVAKLDELMLMCDELEASIKQSQQQNEALLQQVLREALEVK